MRDFFRGWRRTIGVMTLVMACVVMAVWVRTSVVIDGIDFVIFQNLHWVISENGEIVWINYGDRPWQPMSWDTRREWWGASRWIDLYRTNGNPNERVEFDWSCNCMGIKIGRATESDLFFRTDEVSHIVVIPYWSIVIPLTLLSAYLLLSKPRVQKPPVPQSDSLS